MFDDDFELNESDFDSDSQLSIIDEEKLKVIEQIENYTKMVKDNIKFQEPEEYKTNFRILSRYISAMVELNQLEGGNSVGIDDDGEEITEPLSEEEIYEKIKEIESSVKEISHIDLRPVQMDDEEGATLSLDELGGTSNDDDGGDDGSLDF